MLVWLTVEVFLWSPHWCIFKRTNCMIIKLTARIKKRNRKEKHEGMSTHLRKLSCITGLLLSTLFVLKIWCFKNIAWDHTSHFSNPGSSSGSSWAQLHSTELSSPDVHIPPPLLDSLLPHLKREKQNKKQRKNISNPYDRPWEHFPTLGCFHTDSFYIKMNQTNQKQPLHALSTSRNPALVTESVCLLPPCRASATLPLVPWWPAPLLLLLQSQVPPGKDFITETLELYTTPNTLKNEVKCYIKVYAQKRETLPADSLLPL